MTLLTTVLVAVALAAPPSLYPEAGALWGDCAKGDWLSCYKLENLGTNPIRDEEKHAVAIAPFEKGCKKGDQGACYALGMHLDDDGGLPIDGKRAFETFVAGCEAGFAPSCQRASIFYRVSVPASEPGAPKTASALLRKSCDAGWPVACYDLAQVRQVGMAEPVPEPEEEKLLEQGCKLGSFIACVTLAKRILPEPPFACDQCEPNPAERGDEWCIECDLAACRKQYCCPTCPERTKYACCGDEFDAPLKHPLTTPKPDPAQEAANRERVRKLLDPGVKRLRKLCKEGYEPACKDLAYLFANPRLPFHGESL